MLSLDNAGVDQIPMGFIVTSANRATGISPTVNNVLVTVTRISVTQYLVIVLIVGITQQEQLVIGISSCSCNLFAFTLLMITEKFLLSPRCSESYYGDPRLGIDISCRPCPCPGTIEGGHSFASRCALDKQTNDVICECREGYAGK